MAYSDDSTAIAEPKEEPKTEAQEVALWHDRISVAKKAAEAWEQESGAKRFIDEYNGKYLIVFQSQSFGAMPAPPINEVFAYVQADMANTINRDPYITVNPEKAGTVKGAKLWEVILNYKWRELKVKDEIELEMVDKILVGFAWHKVGNEVQSEGAGETLTVTGEKLYSLYVGWRDVVWNLGAKRPPVDCEWMAQRIVRPLKQVKRKYPNAADLKGSPRPEVDKAAYEASAFKDDIEVAILWEVWDKESRQVKLLAEGLTDKYLDAPKPWPNYIDEFPLLMYWDFVAPGKSRPLSAIAPWEPQILEKIIILASAVNHVKRWNRQMIYKLGSIDEKAMDKFERGDDGAMIANTGTGSLDENVKILDFGQLPTDFYLLMDRLSAVERDVNGQPEFERGGVTKTNTRTKSELQMIQAGAKGRADRKVDRLETHLENIARHMLAHMKANFDFEEAIKVTGDTPQEVIEALGENYDPQTGQVTFTPEEIQGEYDVQVKAGSTLPLDKQARANVLEIVLQTVAQVVSRGPMSPFLNALIEEILQDYGVKSLQEAYKMEVAQAQQAQAEQAQSQGVEEAKTGAEAEKRMAQSRQIQAETAITEQEALLGPQGRAMLERAKRPEPAGAGAQ